MHLQKNGNLFKQLVYFIFFTLTCSLSFANDELISLFPLKNYNQQVSSWIKSTDSNFTKPLMNAATQQQHMDLFYKHYFGELSPWNKKYVNRILQLTSPDDVKTMEKVIIAQFDNSGKSGDQIGYGENFRPYDKTWIEAIANNINFNALDELIYQPENRAIAVNNLHVRSLPTDDVHFYSHKLPGQGYPFDNLQMSALWIGTPVYIISESNDHAYMLVITPDVIGWVKSNGIARADNNFIETWSAGAKNKLIAITKTKTSLFDHKGKFLETAYLGAVFPGNALAEIRQIMVPVANTDGCVEIRYVMLTKDKAQPMPMTITREHISLLMNTLISRPYGWGNMYFYNDCSAELKSLLTPFAIWLPRHSAAQVTIGKMVDMTAETAEKRLEYLMQNGQPFLTLIYIGGHVVMYIGNYPDPNKPDTQIAMTYQNLWGLSPNPPTRRAVIGQSVLFPMLLQYPEDATLVSPANKKFFQVSNLNELPESAKMLQPAIDMSTLMYPEILLSD